jgi:hypothetical protein
MQNHIFNLYLEIFLCYNNTPPGDIYMGYTHYWKNKKGFETEEWEKLQSFAEKLFELSGTLIQKEYDDSSTPEITESEIVFNGIGDNGHETCWLKKGNSNFEFCKTACKPYDEVVVALLMAASEICEGFSWSSDGDDSDHVQGLTLYNKVLESGVLDDKNDRDDTTYFDELMKSKPKEK